MTTTRTDLRRAIGDRLGDMILLKPTHASSDTSSFRDVVRLADRGDNAPSVLHRILYFSGGTASNLAHEARVSGFASSTRTVSFTPDCTEAPQEDDEIELWNTTERIGSIDTLHRFINDAIRAVRDDAGLETWDTASTFSVRSPALTIPSTWVEFGGATWTDGQSLLHDVPPDKIRVHPGTRLAIIEGAPAHRAHGRSIQLWGYPRATPLTADSGDDGETDVDAPWLIETVLGWVALAASARASDIRGPAEERRGNFFATQAAMYRRDVAAPRRGLGISL
jgi:hypothetical protein